MPDAIGWPTPEEEAAFDIAAQAGAAALAKRTDADREKLSRQCAEARANPIRQEAAVLAQLPDVLEGDHAELMVNSDEAWRDRLSRSYDDDEEVTVTRSGRLYLLGNKRRAICVDMNEKIITPVMNTQSVFTHLHVSKPWKDIKDHNKLPPLVLEAIGRFRRRT